jgi:hypothetical protein
MTSTLLNSSTYLCCTCSWCNGSKAAAIAALFLSTLLHTLTFLSQLCSLKSCLFYRHPWCCSTCSAVKHGCKVRHGRLPNHWKWWLPIVNGWCQPFAAHAMATTQQSPPLPFMWGNCPLASSAQACILQLFQAYHSESIFGQVYMVLAKPYHHQSHQSTPFLTQKDHYNQMVCHFTSKEC